MAVRADSIPAPRLADFSAGFARRLCAATVAALCAGLVGAGGGRVAMRIMALTSPDRKGALTAADAVIGRFTLGGTIGLILFTAFLSVPVGWAYALTRRWVPGRGRLKALVFGFTLASLLGWTLIDSHNRDFFILHPRSLAIALFLALPFLYGVILASVLEPIERFYARRSFRVPDILAFLPLLFLVPAFIVLPFVALAFLIGWHRETSGASRRFAESSRATRAGHAVLAAAGGAGLVALVMRATDIL